jgi:hypothetical protein
VRVSVLIRGDLFAMRSRTLAWRTARRGAIRVGSGQKSAEVIVAGRQAKLVRHSNAERRSERIGRAANRK